MTDGSTQDPHIGRVLLGQYRVNALLGQGGMGAVYRGLQLSVNRQVAIKLIAGPVVQNPESVKRFRREAESMAKLRHPNTVRLFDFGVTEGGELFMVMELLEGVDLSEHLAQNDPLPPTLALAVTRQILEALGEAHELGIIHRDLKSANIFLSRFRGEQLFVKVMDFGIAGIMEESDFTKLTMTGAVVGTPAYMSPEQARGDKVDGRSDLYSLGVLLFEMLTGKPPFTAGTAVSLLLAQVTTSPPRLQAVRSDLAIDPGVQNFVDRLLAKHPEERPDSAEAAIALVDDLLGNLAETTSTVVTVKANLLKSGAAASSNSAGMTVTDAHRAEERPAKDVVSKLLSLSGHSWLWTASVLFVALLVGVWILWPKRVPRSPVAVLGPEQGSHPHVLEDASPVPEPDTSQRASVAVDGGAESAEEKIIPKKGRRRLKRIPKGQSIAKKSVERSSSEDEEALPLPASSTQDLPAASPAAVEPAPLPSPLSVRERREVMLARGPPYRNARDAKRAYKEGKLDRETFEDNIWVLRVIRKQRIDKEKLNYRRGLITRSEYVTRVEQINAEIEGY